MTHPLVRQFANAMATAKSEAAAPALPSIGSFVRIRFGSAATQIAYVTGHTKTGRVKVRAWNRAWSHWMPNTRTLDAKDILGSASAEARRLPHPEAL